MLLAFAALLLADAIPEWVGIPTGIAGLGIPLGLWLRGITMLRSDHDAQMAAQAAGYTTQVTLLGDRNTALIADRDAWRTAHSAEVDARVAAERAAAAMLEQVKAASSQTDLTGKMLSALMAALGSKGAPDA